MICSRVYKTKPLNICYQAESEAIRVSSLHYDIAEQTRAQNGKKETNRFPPWGISSNLS